MAEKIGEGLIRIGVMIRAQVDDVLKRQKAGDRRLFGEIAIELGYINDEALQSYLGVMTGCKYRMDCHFYNIKEMMASNERLKEVYCNGIPEKCAIFLAKGLGKSVAITFWPTGKLK